jgi:hypothetical protein
MMIFAAVRNAAKWSLGAETRTNLVNNVGATYTMLSSDLDVSEGLAVRSECVVLPNATQTFLPLLLKLKSAFDL